MSGHIIIGRKRFAALCVVGAALAGQASASAAPPADAKCFGEDRAAFSVANHGLQGDELSARKGDNAAINHEYMENCGGPTQPR